MVVTSNEVTTNGSLTERYFELLKNAKVKGYLFQQQNYNDMDPSKPAA